MPDPGGRKEAGDFDKVSDFERVAVFDKVAGLVPPNLFEYLFSAPGPPGTFYRQLAPLLTIGFGSGLGISFVY